MGTLLFNRNTYDAMQAGFDASSYDRLVWTPDVLGSICFLIASYLAYAQACGGFVRRPRRDRESVIATLNLAGSVAFGIAAIAAYWVPTSGSVLDLAAANGFTALGGLCFLIGALLLLPRRVGSPQSDDALRAESLLTSPHEAAGRMLAVALLAVFLAVGCGGDDDSGSSDAPSTTEWAQGLCSAIGDWTSSVSSATGSLQGDNLSEEGLKSAVDDVESATDTFVDDVKGLGTPDTEAGQKAKESVDQLADELDTSSRRSRARQTEPLV